MALFCSNLRIWGNLLNHHLYYQCVFVHHLSHHETYLRSCVRQDTRLPLQLQKWIMFSFCTYYHKMQSTVTLNLSEVEKIVTHIWSSTGSLSHNVRSCSFELWQTLHFTQCWVTAKWQGKVWLPYYVQVLLLLHLDSKKFQILFSHQAKHNRVICTICFPAGFWV